jgi:hypothetical protein
MTSAAFDAWIAKARAVRIEDEIERRGIKLNDGRSNAAVLVPDVAARIGSLSTRRNKSLIAADVARAATPSH